MSEVKGMLYTIRRRIEPKELKLAEGMRRLEVQVAADSGHHRKGDVVIIDVPMAQKGTE